MKKKILTQSGTIEAGNYNDVTFNAELAMICLTATDRYYESVLQLQLSFPDRFTAREAFERLSRGDRVTDLKDFTVHYDKVAADRIGSYLEDLEKAGQRKVRNMAFMELGGRKTCFQNGEEA